MSVPLTINLRSVREAELILKACAELDLRDLETREVDAKWDSTAGRERSHAMSAGTRVQTCEFTRTQARSLRSSDF